MDALLKIDDFDPGFQNWAGWMDDLIRRAFRYWAEDIAPAEHLRFDVSNHAETKPIEGKSCFHIFEQ